MKSAERAKDLSARQNSENDLFRSQRDLSTFIILFLLLFASGTYAAQAQVTAKEDTSSSEKWGIEPVSLKLTAAGQMLDFRYKVTDPQKAVPFFYARNKPVLVDQASGKKLSVPVAPKVGSLRQKTVKPEVSRIYFMLFGNPGIVKDGSKVTLIVGDIKIENLLVEGEPQQKKTQ